MKISRILLSFLLIFSVCQISSCGKKSDNPVDKYVEVLDNATKKIKNIKSAADLSNVKEIISTDEATEIILQNLNYPLTEKDKEKLKKSFDDLLETSFDKTVELNYINDKVAEIQRARIDYFIEAANAGIDNAQKLGDIIGII